MALIQGFMIQSLSEYLIKYNDSSKVESVPTSKSFSLNRVFIQIQAHMWLESNVKKQIDW